MLTENRKRRRGCDAEGEQPNSQAKRPGGGQEGHGLGSDVGRDVWDSESSSSDSSNGISSPERAAGPSAHGQKNYNSQSSLSPPPEEDPSASAYSSSGIHGDDASYDHVNRLLREAHFSSLQSRGRQGST